MEKIKNDFSFTPINTPQAGSFRSSTTPQQFFRHDLYINDEILSGDASIYDHFSILNNTSESDLIYLWINSPGGNLDVANTYVQHLNRCAAPIIGVIGMNCASAATYIALNCSAWEINSMSTFLIHGFSYGTYGKASDVHDSVVFNSKLNERFVREVYQGLLTEEEIVDVLRGRDILLDSEELELRLPLYLEFQELKDQIIPVEEEVKPKKPRKKKE